MSAARFFVCLFCLGLSAGVSAAAHADDSPNLHAEGKAEGKHVDVFPGPEWETMSPESLGFSVHKLAEARKYFEDIGGDALFAVKDGKAFLSWGDVSKPIPNFSIRKSYLNGLLGIEYGEHRVDLQATLDELNIDDKQGLTATEKEANVRDLLTTSSGVYHPGSYESKMQKGARPPRGSFRRGEFFYYNNWDFNALGQVYRQISGEDIFHAFAEKIAAPVGMQDYSLEHTRYRHDDASLYPAYEFDSSARDDARFGYLFLREGRWKDRQLVPREWVRMSTSRQVVTGDYYYYDYGFLWWVDNGTGQYFARGNSGQYIAVLREQDMVIVFRADPGSILRKWLGLRVGPEESFLLIPKILGALGPA
ncbi:MAG: serine hydrolase [Pseudomonadota bacterium]